jgi:hypothetical protein
MSLQVQVPSPQSSPEGEEDIGRGCLWELGWRPYTKLQVREGSEAVWIYDVASSAFDKAVIDSNE